MGAFGTMSKNFKSLSGAPRELWMVYVLQFLESYAYFSMSFILTLYLSEDFGMSDMQAGAIYGMYGALTTCFGFFVGFLIDNLGVKMSLMSGYFLLLIARIAMAFSPERWALKLSLYALLPLGSSLAMPVLSMGIKRYTTETNRGFAFGLYYSVMNVAAMLSGFLVDAFDIGWKDGMDIGGFHLTSKRLILLSGAVVSAVALLICGLFREIKVDSNPDSKEVSEYKVEKASPLQIIKELLFMPLFWKFMAITLICVNLKCIFRYNDALLPKYLVREFGEDVPKGTINAINPALIMILVPIVAAFTSKVSPYKMIHFGAYITALCPLPLCLFTTLPASVAFVTILSVGEAFWSPRFYDLTVSMAPEGREGTFVALGSAPVFLAKLPVGILSGTLLEAFCPKSGERNSQMMWWVIFAITAPAPVLLTLCRKCLGNVSAEDAVGIGSDKIKKVDLENPSSEDETSTDENEESSEESSIENDVEIVPDTSPLSSASAIRV